MNTETTQNNIATDLFYKIRSRFQGLKLGASTGEVTIIPEEARFFDFDYMEGETPVGHVSISLAEPNSMKVYFSHGITETMNPVTKNNWYGFLKELRIFAKRRLLSFDTRDIAKDNLDRRDYAFLSQNSMNNQIGESAMNESTMYGTNKTSYQKLLDTRLIIKHSKTLQDDQVPGARSRNISALFIENQDGERFKYPFIHLAGARAMQRHVANGGLPYDEIGNSIIGMSEEIAQLKSFSNYVVKNDLMNSDTNSIVERSSSALEGLRKQLEGIAKQKHYESYKESFQVRQAVEIPENIEKEFTEKFTVKNFNENIKEVFPIIYRLMQEAEVDNDEAMLEYSDVLELTDSNENVEEESKSVNHLANFENWVMGLGEDNAITSPDPAEQGAAVKALQSLISEHFPTGVDGLNAIESIKGIIDDNAFYSQIKEVAQQDSEADIRPLIRSWVEENAPEVLDKLDFTDMETDQVSADESSDEAEQKEKLNTQELAEFIYSFYDKETKTFPKGPEGVCTMVGKRFGENAENAARKMVERMAPQQSTRNNPELAELSSVKRLAGLD